MSYTRIAHAEPFVGAPGINLPDCFGASPKKPMLLKIPVTGERPITYRVEGLPGGLTVEGGIIKGCVPYEGEYELNVTAENRLGSDTKRITLEIKADTVLLTPLLGFTSWNGFGYEVTAADIMSTAEKMNGLGISEYGYSYINVDSGWQGEYGGEFDAIMPNEKFPDMKELCDRLHEMGFKCGIYSTPMLHAFGCAMTRIPLPPGCTQGAPDDRFADERGGIGVIRKEKNNALQWAKWGFDYLKYDWRPSDPYNAELMRRELVATDRDFGFCVTVKARPEYHKYWEKYCQSYRCSEDSMGSWDSLMRIWRTYFDFIDYINRGHYYDLDMLDIGRCDVFTSTYHLSNYGFTEDEAIVAYTMRVITASPIQLSCVLSDATAFELDLYMNEEVIAINQDSGGHAAKPYLTLEEGDRTVHVLRRRLRGGDHAIAVFNLGKTKENVNVYLDEVSSIRDVWAKCDLVDADCIRLNDMRPHTVRLFRIGKEK